MAIRVSKSKFKVRDHLSKTDTSMGVSGRQITQYANVSEVSSLLLGGRRNIIINPEMIVSQRGDWSSSAYTSSSQSKLYLMDRWAQQNAWTGGAAWSVLNPTVELPTGRTRKTFKLTQTAQTSSGFWHHHQLVEGSVRWKNTWQTASFWYRTNSHGMKVRICNVAVCNLHGDYLIPDGQWHKHVVTWFDHDGADGTWQFHPGFHSPSRVIYANEYIEFTEVQWEFSKVATPFEERSYADELALCQRYYMKRRLYGCVSTGYSQGGGGYDSHLMNLPLPVKMRTAPTVGFENGSASSAFQPGGNTANFGSLASGIDFVSCKTGSTNSTWNTQVVASQSPEVTLDAEL